MLSPSEAAFRRGLANGLGGICAVLLGIALVEAATFLGLTYGGLPLVLGIVIAVAGAAAGIAGALEIERSAAPGYR